MVALLASEKPNTRTRPFPWTCTESTLQGQALILRLGLLLRCPDVRVMHLGRELETRDGLLEMSLQRAYHDEHECLGVAAEGVLEEIGQLDDISTSSQLE